MSFSPDGKSLLYAGERGGSWNLYRTDRTDPERAGLLQRHRAEGERGAGHAGRGVPAALLAGRQGGRLPRGAHHPQGAEPRDRPEPHRPAGRPELLLRRRRPVVRVVARRALRSPCSSSARRAGRARSAWCPPSGERPARQRHAQRLRGRAARTGRARARCCSGRPTGTARASRPAGRASRTSSPPSSPARPGTASGSTRRAYAQLAEKEKEADKEKEKDKEKATRRARTRRGRRRPRRRLPSPDPVTLELDATRGPRSSASRCTRPTSPTPT